MFITRAGFKPTLALFALKFLTRKRWSNIGSNPDRSGKMLIQFN